MRRSSKFVACLVAVAGSIASTSAAQASPDSTSWNNGRTVQYKATATGKPPHGVAHRVSVSDADFYALVRTGDAESYAIDGADADFGLASLFPAGSTLHSIGSDMTHAIGTNENGTIWDATVYAYVKDGPHSGTACAFEYIITPLGFFDGGYSVQGDRVSGPDCSAYGE